MGCAKGRLESEEARSLIRGSGTAFADLRSLTVPDPDHSLEEDRFVLLGLSYRGRLLVVVHVERGDHLRIISARKSTRSERLQYGEAQG
jgi:hypothetical protein